MLGVVYRSSSQFSIFDTRNLEFKAEINSFSWLLDKRMSDISEMGRAVKTKVSAGKGSGAGIQSEPGIAPKRIFECWGTLTRLLVSADITVLALAAAIGHFIRFGTFYPDTSAERMFFYSGVIITVAVLYMARCYHRKTLTSLNLQINTLFMGSAGAALLLLAIGFFSQVLSEYSRVWVLISMIASSIGLLLNRMVIASIVDRKVMHGLPMERVVLVGMTDRAANIARSASKDNKSLLGILGVFEDRHDKERRSHSAADLPVLGTTDDLLSFVRKRHVDRIIITLPWTASERIGFLLNKLRTVPVRIDLVPHEMVWEFPGIAMERIGSVPILTVANARVHTQAGWVKRIEDFFLSSILLIVLSPILLLIAIAIKVDSKGPVFFKQKRHGFNNQVFEVFKFRSMKPVDYSNTEVKQATRNDPRVTRVGKFLRRSSLDELPQLFNVLVGHMSIVGPRPHAVQHNLYYSAIISEYYARHNVRPGITGWAQVNGLRGETDTEDKMRRRVEYDLHYIENWSPFLDLKILVMTAFSVWFQDTAY